MKTLLSIGASLLLTTAAVPAGDLDPCALVPKADVAKLIGEIKEVKTTEGLRKEKQCDYTTMTGAWLKASVYSSDAWDLQKQLLPNDPTPIAGLGEEAFQVKRGTSREVYVRKGKLMLQVSSTVELDATQKFAEAAAKQLP